MINLKNFRDILEKAGDTAIFTLVDSIHLLLDMKN